MKRHCGKPLHYLRCSPCRIIAQGDWFCQTKGQARTEKTTGALCSSHKRAEETLYREGLPGEQVLGAKHCRDGAVYPQNGAYSATVSHLYTFDAASSFSGSTAVTVTDRAGNDSIVPFAVLRDVVSPTVAITVPARSGVVTVTVTWSGNDGAGAGATVRRQVYWRVATHPHQSTPFSWSDIPPGHVAVLDKLWYNPGSVEWR